MKISILVIFQYKGTWVGRLNFIAYCEVFMDSNYYKVSLNIYNISLNVYLYIPVGKEKELSLDGYLIYIWKITIYIYIY